MMGTRIRLAAVLCLALTLGVHAQTPAPAPAAAGIQPAPATVTVLSTGTGEKRAVRYKLVQGAKERIELTMKATISMDIPDAGPQTMDAPAVKMAMDIGVTDVAANGDIALTMAIVSASMDGPGAQEGVLDMLKNLTASLVMTDRGLVKSMNIDDSKLANPMMKQVLSSMGFERLSAPLPAEPVGVGAKWEVVQSMDANGMRLDQKTIFEVVAMDAGSTTFALSMTQTAPAQKIAPPGMPEGVGVNLISMSGEGSGRMALPDGSVALIGDLAITSKVVMEMIAEGINQRMSTATDMKMTVARATSPRRP